jgi:hypothetical protein
MPWILLLMGAALVVLVTWLSWVVLAPLEAWQSVRLAPLMAVWHGQPLYPDPQTGMLTSWIYGPVSVLWYAPTLLARDPSSAIWIGLAISGLTTASLGFGAARLAGAKLDTQAVVALAAVFVASTLISPAVFDAAFHIASDAPALLLSAASVLLSCRARSGGQVMAGGALIALAAWTKQPFVIAAVVPVIVLGRRSLRLVGLYLGGATATGIALGLIFSLVFGASDMLDAMFTVPSSHPWYEFSTAEPRSLGWLLGVVLEHVGPAATIWLIVRVLTTRIDPQLDIVSGRLVSTALALLPMMVLATAKAGGGHNSLGSVGIVFVASAMVRLADHRGSLRLRAGVLVLLAAGALAVSGVRPAEMAGRFNAMSDSHVDRAFRFAQGHREQVYFPWHPLITVMTDGRTYHIEWGIYDLVLADRELSPEHQRAGLPRRIRWIAYHMPTQTELARTYLPESLEPKATPELPGFNVYDLHDAVRPTE